MPINELYITLPGRKKRGLYVPSWHTYFRREREREKKKFIFDRVE